MFRRRSKWKLSVAVVVVCMTAAGAAGWAAKDKGAKSDAPPAQRLKAYQSRYYVIYTDLGDEVAAQASLRMAAMAEEYHRRTSDFAGVIRNRLPFYLFSRAEDYHAAGGLPGSGGQYNGGRRVLMALAGRHPSASLWHTVQHEGFHQFADMVIGGHMPIWLNEGLAEYFSQGIWTGDGFVTGIISQRRLLAVQQHIRNDQITPFPDFLVLSGAKWRGAFEQREKPKSPSETGRGKRGGDQTPKVNRVRINYDQAWSMVDFLVHGENGRCRQSFAGLISDISAGRDWKRSFQTRFGTNVKAFEQRYRDWWLAMPAGPSRDLYVKAHVATLTSFLARATSQGQSFSDVEQFLRKARAGGLKCHPAQKLPASLLESALVNIRGWNRGWSFDDTGRGPAKLVLAWPDGTTFTGSFTVSGGKCANVKITVTSPPQSRAKKLAANKK